MVFVLSSFLDNIAAALIGGGDGAIALSVRPHRVHRGHRGGVERRRIGQRRRRHDDDDDVDRRQVARRCVARVCRSRRRPGDVWLVRRRSSSSAMPPSIRAALASITVDWPRLGIVAAILVAAVAANVLVNTQFPAVADAFPFLGADRLDRAARSRRRIRRPDWSVLPETAKGTAFLLSLVLAASLMPVEHLPTPTWQTTFGLGFVSAVFDNIPLTALALVAGRLRLGHARLRRRLRRLDDLVRFVGRRGHQQHLSRGAIGRARGSSMDGTWRSPTSSGSSCCC